jgi:hypothetical protein
VRTRNHRPGQRSISHPPCRAASTLEGGADWGDAAPHTGWPTVRSRPATSA